MSLAGRMSLAKYRQSTIEPSWSVTSRSRQPVNRHNPFSIAIKPA